MNEFDLSEGEKTKKYAKEIMNSVIERIKLADKDFGDFLFIYDLVRKGKIPNPFRLKHFVAYYSPAKAYRLLAKLIDLGIVKEQEVYGITFYEINAKDLEKYIGEKIASTLKNMEEIKKSLS
jgi:hypothetical protein